MLPVLDLRLDQRQTVSMEGAPAACRSTDLGAPSANEIKGGPTFATAQPGNNAYSCSRTLALLDVSQSEVVVKVLFAADGLLSNIHSREKRDNHDTDWNFSPVTHCAPLTTPFQASY